MRRYCLRQRDRRPQTAPGAGRIALRPFLVCMLNGGSFKPASRAACGHRDPGVSGIRTRSGTPGILQMPCSPPQLRRTIQIQEHNRDKGGTQWPYW